ncbi:hypothetical protein GCM10012279_00030 [Micromonospora yangpuensis]|nr:hypothetical protein GCM10012279_00030 [Micromonospora yangpuensis]
MMAVIWMWVAVPVWSHWPGLRSVASTHWLRSGAQKGCLSVAVMSAVWVPCSPSVSMVMVTRCLVPVPVPVPVPVAVAVAV